MFWVFSKYFDLDKKKSSSCYEECLELNNKMTHQFKISPQIIYEYFFNMS